MPELPDILNYIESLEKRILRQTLERVQITSPFLLRTAVPSISSIEGKQVVGLRRLGKRICIGFEEDLWLVLHLMIAGRLHWLNNKKQGSKIQLAALRFSNGTLTMTEAGTRKRASLHLFKGTAALSAIDPGGLEVLDTTVDRFAAVIQSRNHTLKRALTDPRLLSGIGNAYSDEILFAARLSPVALTQRLKADEVEQLFAATHSTLHEWIDRLHNETGEGFPEKVTAFHPEMAVHGRYGKPCRRCGAKIQRIRYASNETNYCPNCQTGGKLLADRALSRLLREDWPRTAEELEG